MNITKFALLVIVVIVLSAGCLFIAGSMVERESHQAAWNSHCVRDNLAESDVQACITSYGGK